MLKNILNLKGAQQLNKSEQNSIHGGGGSRCSTTESDFCIGVPQGQCCGPDLGGGRKTCNSGGCCTGPVVKYCFTS